MGILNFFKRKSEPKIPSLPSDIGKLEGDLGLGKDITGLGGVGTFDSNQPQQIQMPPTLERIHPGEQQFPPNTFVPNRPSQPQSELLHKDIEIISYKIDALKAAMESMNQRLANLETIAKGSQEKSRYNW